MKYLGGRVTVVVMGKWIGHQSVGMALKMIGAIGSSYSVGNEGDKEYKL